MLRSTFLTNTAAILAFSSLASAFEGGVGGLGKTKPVTGVQLWDEESVALQNAAGLVSAELAVQQSPVRVNFQTPWPLMSSYGLEARDLQNPESAFVQVVEHVKEIPTSKSTVKELLVNSVLSGKGKFGAYGAPIDIKVKKTDKSNVWLVDFTTYTPGQRESERSLFVKLTSPVSGSLVLLVVGSTRLRFAQKQSQLEQVVDSFEAIPAPATQLRR